MFISKRVLDLGIEDLLEKRSSQEDRKDTMGFINETLDIYKELIVGDANTLGELIFNIKKENKITITQDMFLNNVYSVLSANSNTCQFGSFRGLLTSEPGEAKRKMEPTKLYSQRGTKAEFAYLLEVVGLDLVLTLMLNIKDVLVDIAGFDVTNEPKAKS